MICLDLLLNIPHGAAADVSPGTGAERTEVKGQGSRPGSDPHKRGFFLTTISWWWREALAGSPLHARTRVTVQRPHPAHDSDRRARLGVHGSFSRTQQENERDTFVDMRRRHVFFFFLIARQSF